MSDCNSNRQVSNQMLERALEAYERAGLRFAHTTPFSGRATQGLRETLLRGELPVALVSTSDRGALLLTDRQLHLLGSSLFDKDYSWEYHEAEAELTLKLLGSNRLTLVHPDGITRISRPRPLQEAHRLCWLLSGVEDPRQALGGTLKESDPPDPGDLPGIIFGDLAVYSDRIVDERGNHYRFGETIDATAEEFGNITAVRGRNLAEKFGATLLFGPIGPFIAGNAKTTKMDDREVILIIESGEWSLSRNYGPDRLHEVVEFAAQLRSFARGRPTTRSPVDDSVARLSEEIRELAKLREDGLITEEEFNQQKARLLGD